jgi:uncharacterized protein YecE (DUF72 family)
MKHWHIGCSGFHYKHWKGSFYPEGLAQKNWFEYYCQHFNSLELNVTFYRFPQLSFTQGWYNKSPQGFSFSVKAPRAITHYKKFTETEQLIEDFYDVISKGLKEKLGCVLFQMPPSYNYTEEKLEKIISSLDSSFNNVVEFRHISWWDDKIYRELATHNITFCGMSHPLLPDDVIKNTPVLYYRLHGVPQLYLSLYTSKELKKLADDIKASRKVKQAFIYFNNDIEASAIANAKQLMEFAQK